MKVRGTLDSEIQDSRTWDNNTWDSMMQENGIKVVKHGTAGHRIEGHRTAHSTMESKQRQGTHTVSQATVTDKKADTFTKAKVW